MTAPHWLGAALDRVGERACAERWGRKKLIRHGGLAPYRARVLAGLLREVGHDLDRARAAAGGAPSPADGDRVEVTFPDELTVDVSYTGGVIRTVEQLMEAGQLDPAEWVPLEPTLNAWTGLSKTGMVQHFQVKCRFQRRLEASLRPPLRPRTACRKPPEPRAAGVRCALLIPDTQVGFAWRDRYTRLEPMHDRRAMDAVVQLARIVQPDVAALLGDMGDLAPWSTRFPRRPEYRQTTQPSIDELHWWLAELREAAPSAEMPYLAGNHEERIRKAQVELLQEAVGLRAVGDDHPALAVERLLGLDRLDIEYVGPYGEDWWLWGRIRITHGDIARGGAGKSATAHVAREAWPIVYGHTHHRELVARTLHGPGGRHVVTAMSPGCLCRVDGAVPGVSARPDWQQGVGVAYLDESTGAVHLHSLPIEDGRLVWHGRVIEGRARDAEIAEATGWTQMVA